MFEKKKKKKKQKFERCFVCGTFVKADIREKNSLPYGLRKGKLVICANCLDELNDENSLIAEGYRLEVEDKGNRQFLDTRFCPKISDERVEAESEEEMMSEEYYYETEKALEIDSGRKGTMDFNEMVESIKNVVKGQDAQVEKLCATVIRNSSKKDSTDISRRRNHLIIVGDSGTGKTLMLDELAKVTNKVCSYENATSYTEEGYVGDSVNDMLINLIDKAGGNLELAQKGIIIVDEGDKKAGADGHGRDVSGNQVLFGMLKMLDGAKINVTRNRKSYIDSKRIIFDTSELTFVFIGVFPGIENVAKKRLTNKASIGFESIAEKVEYVNKELMARDFVPLGFPKEFIARFSVVIKMNPMTNEIVNNILLSKSSYLQEEIKRMRDFGVEVIIPDNVINEIVEEVLKQNIGARGIEQVVNYVLEDIWYNILKNKNFTKCSLLKGITSDNKKYKKS